MDQADGEAGDGDDERRQPDGMHPQGVIEVRLGRKRAARRADRVRDGFGMCFGLSVGDAGRLEFPSRGERIERGRVCHTARMPRTGRRRNTRSGLRRRQSG